MKATGNGRRDYAYADAAHDQHLHDGGRPRSGGDHRVGEEGGVLRQLGGGQVDITSGKYVFNVTEAFKIENGSRGARSRAPC